ncbi:Dabb family protein [Rhodococcus chondri]|uniref:Dabb family protein n=1 Tax=Rhodococcus chondri TaxID=3065941 RepID=A0ABU7JM34_9NOCA|nr:Dabb family protein [Rhodococcus sp. CC-R104]MEE2031100.1 Dabb family protein [Rhodococcus sp. CC-R104]
MYNVIRVVHFAEAADASDRAEYIETVRIAVKELGALRQLVAPTLPGVINGGDALVHLHFPSAEVAARHTVELDAALRGPITVRVDGVGYPARPAQARLNEPRTLYRALLIRVDPSVAADAVERFERDLLKMPDYISSIVAWRLSRVTDSVGSTEWTHVWEQEFTDRAALMGQYLNHPVHWSVVDRWFDPECPESVVRDRVCHTFCTVDDIVVE